MLKMFTNVNTIPMMSGSANYGWQWVGLTLSYTYQGE